MRYYPKASISQSPFVKETEVRLAKLQELSRYATNTTTYYFIASYPLQGLPRSARLAVPTLSCPRDQTVRPVSNAYFATLGGDIPR
jgi:hypothetical protein